MSHSEQIYSPIIFINRENEIKLFEEMLESSEASPWILQIVGIGGIGKTQLLLKYIDLLEERKKNRKGILYTRELIDIYWTRNHREVGLLKSIADQLAPDCFEAFYKQYDKYAVHLAREELLDPTLEKLLLDRARKAFNECYEKLNVEAIVIFFDTAEQSTDAVLRFFRETLAQLKMLQTSTFIIIGGRELKNAENDDQTDFPSVFGSQEASSIQYIQAFGAKHIQEYFEKSGIALTQDIAERLAELSGGRPVLIALTLDWIRDGHALAELLEVKPEAFEHAVISRIAKLRYPEDQGILAMAHLYRRFNETILAEVLDEDIAEATSQIESLSRFSFIKYRHPSGDNPGSCLLHDEVRDLINKYIWPALDPLWDYRRGWDEKIVEFYRHRINDEQNPFERWNLRLERLFYWFRADTEEAFNYSRFLFQQARERYHADLMTHINSFAKERKSSLTFEQQLEIEFRDAYIFAEREQLYKEAIERLHSILQNLGDRPALILRAMIYSKLVEFYASEGENKKAIDKGNEWKEWFESHENEFEPGTTEHQIFHKNFGWLCHSIGFAFRHQSRLQGTIHYYEEALKHFHITKNAYSQIADTKNNLGYVYHKLGRDEEAQAHCDIALKMRQKIGSPDQLGYSYNVLAMIYVDQLREDEAIASFERATKYFEEARNERGKALVNVAYGRALRQLGRYKENKVGEDFNPERKEYRLAGEMFTKAIDTFRKLPDKTNLSEALNEYGTLLRQQERWDEAITQLEESKKLSGEIGNDYRVVDNMADLAILYDYKGNLDKSLELAQQASKLALDPEKGLNAYNLYAKAQRVVSNALFHQGKYDDAFGAAGNACVFITRLDPERLGESAAKRELYYDEYEDWLSDELILKLESQDQANKYTNMLIDRWKKEIDDHGQKLIDSKPGFAMRMKGLAENFKFLKQDYEG